MNKKIQLISKGELDESAVWFMRQAGRYLPEYTAIKNGKPFIDLLKDREKIEKISLLPLKALNVDAIVVFTDILLPYTRMGYEIDYESGITLKKKDSGTFDYYVELREAVSKISSVNTEKTIIGVVGGPFTCLSYLYDHGMKGYYETKSRIVNGDTAVLKHLIEELIEFTSLQVRSGVDVVQVFDSWIGSVSESFYENYLEKYEDYFVEKIRELGKPVIFFSEGSSHLYPKLVKLNADVFSIDWRIELARFKEYCNGCIVQGNLDPYLLNSSEEFLRKETRRIMDQGKDFQGHIFNLGHGVPPWADVKKLKLIVEEVHNYER